MESRTLWATRRPLNVSRSVEEPNVQVLEPRVVLSGGGPLVAEQVGTFDGQMSNVEVVNSLAYVTSDDGLLVLDVSAPTTVYPMGHLHLPSRPLDICVVGSLVYVADGTDGLQVIDVCNPRSPVIAGSCDLPGAVSSISVENSFAYLAGTTGLHIVNVSESSAPVPVARYDLPDGASGVAASQSYTYLLSTHEGLTILDTGNPTAPAFVGFYGDWLAGGCVSVAGSYAYVMYEDSRCEMDSLHPSHLGIVDISEPAVPKLVSTCDLSPLTNHIYGLTISGSRAYVLGADGLSIINAIDPKVATRVGVYGSYITPGVLQAGGYSHCISVVGTGVYLADAWGGQILRVCPTEFHGTAGDDTYVVRIAADGQTVEIYENAPLDGPASYSISRSALTGLSFDLGDGNDTIVVDGDVPCTISGGAGDDCITGGSGADLIYGGDGNDTIFGGAGADTIYANFGDDSVEGGSGRDEIHGGLGNDTQSGGNGSDLIFGGQGDDDISGGGKSDTIYGCSGSDTLRGGAGNDLIYGGGGDDWIYVNDGPVVYFHDGVYGGAGVNHVDHDAGDTIFGPYVDILA